MVVLFWISFTTTPRRVLIAHNKTPKSDALEPIEEISTKHPYKLIWQGTPQKRNISNVSLSNTHERSKTDNIIIQDSSCPLFVGQRLYRMMSEPGKPPFQNKQQHQAPTGTPRWTRIGDHVRRPSRAKNKTQNKSTLPSCVQRPASKHHLQ